MTGSTIQYMTTTAALSAAVLVSGCCGPRRDRTASYYSPNATSQQYSSTSSTANQMPQTYTSPAATETQRQATESERTNVRETVANGNEWTLPLYSESLRVGKREVENGSVRLHKVVRTENAAQPVDLRRETVVIDREAFDQARRAADNHQSNDLGVAFQDKEITIDLKREEPVVEVSPYISGRIVAQKRVTTDHQNVERQVRHEDVEIIKNGNDRDITVSERVNTRVEATGAPANNQNRQSGTVNGNDHTQPDSTPRQQ